jgi:PhnB protein
MSDVNAYLFFDGNCAEAMRFYQSTLGGELHIMTHADAPDKDQIPPGAENRVMHARLLLDGRPLMASDWMPGQPYDGMKGFYLSLVYPTTAEAQRIFDALSEGGRVNMPMQQTFWVEAFGMLVDRFGTPWMINGGKPANMNQA